MTVVHRTLIDSLRTILVWVIDIIIFYLSKGSFGESWNAYSYVQLIGFSLLVIGTIVYNGVIKIPGLIYEQSGTPQETHPLLDKKKSKLFE